jgi:pimeloyl-ACP methyl ester carboxylesterase
VVGVFATSGAAQIAYDVTGGAPDGVDVVLFHAGVTDRRSWKAVVDRLMDRYRCVTFDARQFGETTYEPDPGWSRANDAVAVMDAAGVERAVVVACSMGGATALDVALEHADRVSGLVLIGSAIRGAPYPENSGNAARLEELAEKAEEAADFDELNRLDAWMWLDGPEAPEGRVGGETRALFLAMNGIALRAAHPGELAEQEDSWPRLAELAMPTLLMVGKLDMPEIIAINEQAAARIPGARLVWLDGVAHLPQLEGDPACLAQIQGFVDGMAERT